MGYSGIIVTGRCDLKIMIQGLLWELQLRGDFSLVKKNYVRVAFTVWKLAPPGFLYQKIPSVLFTGAKKWKNCSLDVDTLFDVLFFHSFLFGEKRPSISEVLSLFFPFFF